MAKSTPANKLPEKEERSRECRARGGERERERETGVRDKRRREGRWRRREMGCRLKEKREKSAKEKEKKHPVIYEVPWSFHFFLLSLASQGLLVEFKQPWHIESSWQEHRKSRTHTHTHLNRPKQVVNIN